MTLPLPACNFRFFQPSARARIGPFWCLVAVAASSLSAVEGCLCYLPAKFYSFRFPAHSHCYHDTRSQECAFKSYELRQERLEKIKSEFQFLTEERDKLELVALPRASQNMCGLVMNSDFC